jgi:DNA-binding IscR family transcriptional regulator
MKTIKNISILLIVFILSVHFLITSVTGKTLLTDKKDKNSARSVNKHARKNYRNQLKKIKLKKFRSDKQKPERHYPKNGCNSF